MAQVNNPNVAQKDDALTTIMKGLSIASQIYGIRANAAQLEDYQQKQQRSADMAAGKYTKGDQIALGEKYDISPTQPTSGSYQQATDAASGSPLYLSLKKDSSPILKEIKGMQNGQYGTIVKDYRTGKQVDFIADQAKPEKVEYLDQSGNKVIAYVDPKAGEKFTSYAEKADPVKVDTVDEKGNPIVSFVTPKAGDTYASQQKADQKPNKEQFDAALYGRRLESANSIFQELADKGYDRSSYMEGIKAYISPESSYSPKLKSQVQAERNFLTAVLRRESGASISPTEFSTAEQQYFPRAGDTADVLAQKAQNREQAIAGLKAAAGKAWDQVPLVAKVAPKKDSSGELQAAPSLQIGAEEGGYIYQGGDPGSQQSWKKK